jgi:hypothetical protein
MASTTNADFFKTEHAIAAAALGLEDSACASALKAIRNSRPQ